MQPAAAREATSEERRTTSLGVPRIGGGSATSVRSKHIVKPTPPSSPTMPRCRLLIPAGSDATPNRDASSDAPKMPSGFPSSRPAPMPAAGASDACAKAAAAAPVAGAPSGTAVFASAKRGMMPKVERGERRTTARWVSASETPDGAVCCARVEMQKAESTPAMSALMPARSRQYHRAAPPAANAFRSEEPVRPKAARPAVTAAAAARKGSETLEAKQVARTRMAPRSSTVARVRRKAEAEGGMRLRKRPADNTRTPDRAVRCAPASMLRRQTAASSLGRTRLDLR
mmetsp:Transcript_25367/g.81423  ORF Transcript_25367/g.81423 Transcript_25367/m.81423 type:complete len:286 (+) Transcript_25367:242-1099(+)